ncbi:MAG: TCP-1/cpn60 chaperonin family protein [Candidatus Heimdallarchaeum aukensis]|uniref:TCP-1/cpn60 chaperonin family protein n=1 Tax=Candidatus Heimdallarchaeum aukensis TaxID=2876573 RepID=A0A9Y1FMS6_9ARCH|nr:MAG: TCP-1/cpn60 chaperonin family protein [Candidatus Heimdallarchaeum aukensis]
MNEMYGQPIYILKEGTERTTGKDAQRNNISAAKAVAEAVRTALGPKGMDKMLVDGFSDATVTNDGVTILKEIEVQHPAAKFVIDLAKTQDQETGDGTTTVVVIAGELLKQAEELLDINIHPSLIIEGYKLAMEEVKNILEKIAIPVPFDDAEMMKNISMTSMSSKIIASEKEFMSDIVVEAVRSVTEDRDGKKFADIDNILIQKKRGGSIRDTELIKGLLIDKEFVHPDMPKKVTDAKILLLDKGLELSKTEIDAKLQISTPDQVQAFLDNEHQMLKDMAEKIIASGANVVLCQKGIDDIVQHYLAKSGIAAVRRIKKSDMKKLARATGAKITTSLEDLSNYLGTAGLVEEVAIGDDHMIKITDCKDPKAVSILIRGGTEMVVNEAERAIHDALCVVRQIIHDEKAVAGGGAPEIEIAYRLAEFAKGQPSKIQKAVEQFAKAMEIIPRTLAENAGLDPIDILSDLYSKHAKNGTTFGVDPFSGSVADMKKLNVIEPISVKKQAISSASEAAMMILRIDDVIAAKELGEGPNPPGPGGEDFD